MKGGVTISTISKTIKYYKILAHPTIQFYETANNPLEAQTYNIFLKAFPEVNYYEHKYEKVKYGIDIIEMTTEYLFAQCSVSNNITPTSFIQIRDAKTKQRKPLNIDNLEKYTYLLLDFCTNRMVLMAGRGLSKINEVIIDYMYKNTSGLSDIVIIAEKIEDFEKNTERFSKINNLEFKVADNTYKYVTDLDTALKGVLVEDYTINFKIKEKGDNFFEKLKNLKDKNSKIQGIKAYGKNEYNLDDVIDFFATQFTRTIPIDISDDNALDQEYIKNKLISVLN